jgi:hypothetical protein
MPNTIIGLEYNSLISKIQREEDLIYIFSALKDYYDKFRKDFKILTPKNQVVNCFGEFLEIAVNDPSYVILSGSGNIGGLEFKDARIKYDLSEVRRLTSCWNERISYCNCCRNYEGERVDIDEVKWGCKIKTHSPDGQCDSFDGASIRGLNDSPKARPLEAIISDFYSL